MNPNTDESFLIEHAQRCLALARRAGADAADAMAAESASLCVTRRMGKQEGLERSQSTGVGLRAFVGKRSASASSTDFSADSLEELAERAVAMARAAPEDADSGLAPEALLARNVADLDLLDALEPSAIWLMEQCAEAEDVALATSGITNSEGADAQWGTSALALVTSGGFAHAYRTSHASLSISVIAGTGTGMERDYDFSSARHKADLASAAGIGRSAASRALRRLGARKAATQAATVVFDPRVSRKLLYAFASAVNGSAITRGSSFLKHAMGKPVFAAGVTIIDDPHIKRGLASRPFDAEGVQNRPMAIVQDGVLRSWLLDCRTANRLGLASTGHAVRGLGGAPYPSPSNLYMQKGALTPAALMDGIASGFYVTETFGMGVNTVTGDYSQGAAGFWIDRGEIAYPVSEITIAGNLADMFLNATPADDLVMRHDVNAPTLRVEGMMVAGR